GTDSHLTGSSDVTITLATVAVPTLLSVSPNLGAPGQANIPVTITGQNTHFTNASAIDVGPGITVGNVAATDATHLTAQLTIAASATVGSRTLRVTTGEEVVSLPNAFTVLSGPTITATPDRPANQAGWYKANVTVTFTRADPASGIATCPSPIIVSTEGANQVISGTAVNRVGITATTSILISLDKTPPVVAFTSPAEGSTQFASSVTASGTVIDSLSGVASVGCNGASASSTGQRFNCTVTLTPGANSISATATDVAGNTGTSSLSLTYRRVPVVTITSPANLSYLNLSPTTVTGTVGDP